MPILFNDFGGLIPRIDNTKLPETAAQVANNTDLTSGTIRPLNVGEAGFIDFTDNLGMPEDEVFSIDEPAAPTLRRQLPFSYGIDQFVDIYGYVVLNRLYDIYDDDGEVSETIQDTILVELRSAEIVNSPDATLISRSDLGVTLGRKFQLNYQMEEGYRYYLSGPRFQFKLIHYNWGAAGSPEETIIIPEEESEAMRMFPRERVPLLNADNEVYGYFEIEDSNVVPFDEDTFYQIPDDASWNDDDLDIELGMVTFNINLNYIINAKQDYYYILTYMKDRENEVEGPASELSERISVQPGYYNEIYIPSNDEYSAFNLYRSSTGSDDFLLVATEENVTEYDPDDANSSSFLAERYFIDTFSLPLTTALPTYGNYPGESLAAFLEGSFIHPAQFGVGYNGSTLYFSEFYKLHVWPDEYTLPFQENILGIGLTGNTIIVFTENNVFGVSGGNPSRMSKYLISNTAPLSSYDSICQIDNTIFYASTDGLFAVSGGSIQNITKDFYDRDEWQELEPEYMDSKVADNSIYLESRSINLRFDLEEGIKAVSTYDTTDGTGEVTWKSKKFYLREQEVFDYVKIDADAEVTFNVYADEELVGTYSVIGDTPVVLDGTGHAANWEFEAISTDEIRSIEVYERNIIPMSDYINLNKSNTPVWESSWLKFPDIGSFSGGILDCETTDMVLIQFYHETYSLVHTEAVFSGRLFELPTTLPNGTLWRIAITGSDKPINSLTLFSRRRQPILDSIRELRQDPTVQPWALKIYESIKPISLSSAQIYASSYPVYLTVKGDGNELFRRRVDSEKPIRLPRTGMYREHTLYVEEGDGVVQQIALATSMTKLKG